MKLNGLNRVLVLALAAVVAMTSFTGDAQARKRSAAKRAAAARVAASAPKVASASATPATSATKATNPNEKTLTKGGTTVTIVRYDSPAYYKVSKSEAGYSSGYCDNSFAIDWPTATTTGNITQLQQWMLKTVGNSDNPVKTVSALIKQRNKCEYSSARKVKKMPQRDDDTPLSDKADITVKLLTDNVVEIAQGYEAYYGGGTGASFMYGTAFYYYDLRNGRALETADLFTPQVANAIVQQLRQDPDGVWDSLWDDFKENPHVPDNFCITADKVVFIYGKYEIAAGYAGNVEAEVPIEQVLPYATPLRKSIVAAMNN